MSLDLMGLSDSQFPWHALEQPSMMCAFGRSAGTTTLNYWISKSSNVPPPAKPTGDAKPRKMKLLQILDRLQTLEDGLEHVSLLCSSLRRVCDLIVAVIGPGRVVPLSLRYAH
jgi:hypothetical protein